MSDIDDYRTAYAEYVLDKHNSVHTMNTQDKQHMKTKSKQKEKIHDRNKKVVQQKKTKSKQTNKPNNVYVLSNFL